jgi:tyrosyl-tRNA synthetase
LKSATKGSPVRGNVETCKIIDLFTKSGLTSSNGDAKKMLQSGSLFVNEAKIQDPQMTFSKEDFVNGVLLLRKGKKLFKIVKMG